MSSHTKPTRKRMAVVATSVLAGLIALAVLVGVLIPGSSASASAGNGTTSPLAVSMQLESYTKVVSTIDKSVTTAPATAGTVKVQAGDTLSGIAAAHCSDSGKWRDLGALNKLANADVLNVGQTLALAPGCSVTATTNVVTTSETHQDAPPAKSKTAPPAKTAQAPPAASTKKPVVKTPPPAKTAANGTVWDRLAQCESSGNWHINTGNGFSGGLQFTPSTWAAFGGTGAAYNASREQQIAVAERVLAAQGWGAWPACTKKLGLR